VGTCDAWVACLRGSKPIAQVALRLPAVCWADRSAHVVLELRQDPTILGYCSCRT